MLYYSTILKMITAKGYSKYIIQKFSEMPCVFAAEYTREMTSSIPYPICVYDRMASSSKLNWNQPVAGVNLGTVVSRIALPLCHITTY